MRKKTLVQPRSLANFADSMKMARLQAQTNEEFSQWLTSLPRETHLAFLYYVEYTFTSLLTFVWEKEKISEETGPVSRKAVALIFELIRQSMELGVCRQLTPEQLAYTEDWWSQPEEEPEEESEEEPEE